jgi:Predicted nucleotide-binding protein containing TIR-like domain
MDSESVQPIADPKKVFVVHGHANDMKEAAARTIEKLGLEAVILHEQPSGGKTLIEKFEINADVGFAVVLLSGDDMAYQGTIPAGEAKSRPRARQNVLLELGYFIGSLGRNKVFTLLKEVAEFEFPSDYYGVIYEPYDSAGHWKFRLAQELASAGFTVDDGALIGKTREKEAKPKGKIESPKEGEMLPPGYCEVRGHISNYSGQPLYVMTGKDGIYWPAGRLVPKYDMSWISRVNFGSQFDTHTIFFAAVDQNTATLIEFYLRTAAAERRWTGVPIYALQGVLDRMVVKTDLTQEPRKAPRPEPPTNVKQTLK